MNLFIDTNIKDNFYYQNSDENLLKCPICNLSHTISEMYSVFSKKDISKILKTIKEKGNQISKTEQNKVTRETMNIEVDSQEKHTLHFHCLKENLSISTIIEDIATSISEREDKQIDKDIANNLFCPYCNKNLSSEQVKHFFSGENLRRIKELVDQKRKFINKLCISEETNNEKNVSPALKEVDCCKLHCSNTTHEKGKLIREIIDYNSKNSNIWKSKKKLCCMKCLQLMDPHSIITNLNESEILMMIKEIENHNDKKFYLNSVSPTACNEFKTLLSNLDIKSSECKDTFLKEVNLKQKDLNKY